MMFLVIDKWDPLPDPPEYPFAVLRKTFWDDYSYKTTFEMTYFNHHNVEIFSYEVKILDKNSKSTVLDSNFDNGLDERFCSLGQSLDYYRAVSQLDLEERISLLSELNDAVFNPEVREKFIGLEGFKKSLIRFSDAQKALNEGAAILGLTVAAPDFGGYPSFSFACRVPGALADHRVEFDFQQSIPGLSRISALIGRNGTGKTQVLANLANALSGWRPDAGEFVPNRPNVSKVIAISYSVFDKFERPPDDTKTYSYKYCGIRKGPNVMTGKDLRAALESSIKVIRERNRSKSWTNAVQILLGTAVDSPSLLVNEATHRNILEVYDLLSSGQRILLLVMTQVIANIEKDAMLLFDEPEIHLHPEAVATVAFLLHELLEEYSAYAIVATHSPIVLQEIPARFVHVFRRQGGYPLVSRLYVESFGESLTNITDDVFETSEERQNYRKHLRELALEMDMDEILRLFEHRLSFNAVAFLHALYADK